MLVQAREPACDLLDDPHRLQRLQAARVSRDQIPERSAWHVFCNDLRISKRAEKLFV